MATTFTHEITIKVADINVAIDTILQQALGEDMAQFVLEPHELITPSNLTFFWLGNTLHFHLMPNINHAQRQGSACTLEQARQVLIEMLDGTVYFVF